MEQEKMTMNQAMKNWKKEWEEIQLCGELLRRGRAKIVVVTRKDGSRYRYTKLM
jgi:exonuclease VII small subunit